MKEKHNNDDPEFNYAMFQKVIERVKTKGGKKYEFVLKAGQSLFNALFRLFEVVWNGEKIPESWRETTIIQIWKGKGPREDLENIRHIHTKNSEIPKLFGNLITNLIKPTIEENISPFQIGAMSGHRSEEHLFTLKSVLALVEKNKEATSIQLLDLVKYFDSESLADALNELHREKVRGELYRIVYEMKRKTRIKVRTSVGDSEERVTNENITQGSAEGGVLSSSNLGKGVEDFFSSSETETYYGLLKLLPQSYQDDLMRLSKDPVSAQYGFDRFETIAETKLLLYNSSKTVMVFMGAEKARKELVKELEENPPMLYNKPVKIERQWSYLGEELGLNLAESILMTINKRIGLGKKSFF